MSPWNAAESLSSLTNLSLSALSNDAEVETPSVDDLSDDRAAVSRLRVAELKAELARLGADYHDCFDKESLMDRLLLARRAQPAVAPHWEAEEPAKPSGGAPSTSPPSSSSAADLEAIQSMSVRDLKAELASRNVRWAGLLEKKDLVQAVANSRRAAASFSATGSITPGLVADLTADQVMQEVELHSSLLLLDVYATWCGPCQLMASILKQAATELPQVRFAKLDSDRFPELSSQWRVQGLPTLLLFQQGREVARLEGAVPKDQLIQWVQQQLQSTTK